MGFGSIFNEIVGVGGSVTVPGLGAVIGTFDTWKITRARTSDGQMSWTFRGVFSYVNEPMMKSDQVKKKISLTFGKENTIMLCSWTDMTLSGSNIELKGAQRCL